jgi:O-glycosyl hydrolase
VRRFVLLLVVLVATSCSSSSKKSAPDSTTVPTVAVAPGTPTVQIDDARAQRIDGFGASGAWWPNDLARFPAEVQDVVGKYLFDPSGIGLSGYRYNIGGGGKGVTNPARAPKQVPEDDAGLIFLRAAVNSKVPVLTGFVNSAPPEFTTNGKACGGQLAPGKEAAFAKYLVDMVVYLRDKEDVKLQYVSPMNEPDDSFADCGQEGMQVTIPQRAPLVKALADRLKTEAPDVKVIADETTADVILASEAPQWLPDAKDDLAAIAHHTYDFPNEAIRKAVPPVAKLAGKPTWMTEACCYKGSGEGAQGFGAQYDPTMKQGFWLANQIRDDLTIAGDSAWYWWTALSPVIGCDPKADPGCASQINNKGFNDGLLYYDEHYPDGTSSLFLTKRLWVLGQFSRYVRPGAYRHDVSGARNPVMVFENGDQWTIVTWNEATTNQSFAVSLPKDLKPSVAAQTNGSDELASRALPRPTATGEWVVEVPARTIATYVFKKGE